MTGIAKPRRRYGKRIKDGETDDKRLYSLLRRSEAPSTGQSSILAGASAGTNAGEGKGNFLPTAGGTMIGPIAFFPRLTTISSGEIDISNTTDNFSSRVIVTPETGSTDDLVTITGAAWAGQLLFIQGVATDTITVKNSGNIETIDGTDFDIVDDDIIIFMYDTTDTAWQQVTIGKQGVASMGDDLGNHTATQALDLASQDLYFVAGGAERMDSGGASNIRLYTASTLRGTFDATGLSFESGYRLTMDDEIRFTGITKPGDTSQSKIYAENLTNDELVLNAPTSGKVRFDIAGTTVLEHGVAELQLTADGAHTTTIFNDDVDTTDDSTISIIDFQAFDSSDSTADIYSRIDVSISDNTSGTEDGRIKIGVIDGGLLNGTFMKLESFAGEGNFTLQADEKDFVIEIIRDEATNDTGQIGAIEFITNDTLTNATQFGKIRVDADVTTNGAESATFTMQAYNAGSQDTFLEYTGGTGIVILDKTTDQLGFYGSAGNTRQTLSGARNNPEAALAGLITALANVGIIVDTTTAS